MSSSRNISLWKKKALVDFSEVKSSSDFRIDAEFYNQEFRQNEKLLKNLSWIKLEVSNIQFGTTPSGANFKNKGIPFIRSQDFVNGYIDTERLVYISKEDHHRQIKSSLRKNDILIAAVGATIGAVGLLTTTGGNFNQNVARIRLRHETLPEFLFVFLRGKFGQYQLEKLNTGNAQPYLNTPNLSSLIAVCLKEAFQAEISKVVRKAFLKIDQARSLYQEAKLILLSELGLADWQPKHFLTFVKNYSDTKQAERIDADYFQPEYDEVINVIKNCSGGWSKLGDLVSVRKCVEVGSAEYLDDGIPFVRVSNLSPFGITKEKYISESLYSEIKQHQPEQGEIIFTKDATPGIAYYLNENPEKMILSSGILRLKTKTEKINNEYLTLVLNSLPTKEQVNRDVGGSVILHWRPEQVKETTIPILPKKTRTEIQQKVVESLNLRKQFKQLLEYAKRAVEIAIEEEEETAIKWLADRVTPYGNP